VSAPGGARPAGEARLPYDAILSAARQIAVDWDPSSGAMTCAGATERLLGRRPGELGTLDALLAALAGDDRDAVADAFAHARGRHEPIAIGARSLRGDVELAGEVFRADPGDHVLALLRDVTAQRRIEDAHARHAEHALLVGEIGDALTRTTTMRAMLQRCAESLVRHLDAALARIWTLNADTGVLELEASAGLETSIDGAQARIPIGEGRIGRIPEEGVPYVATDLRRDGRVVPREWAQHHGLVAFAGHPLILDTRVVGVIAIFTRRPLSEGTVDALATIAGSIALGVERKRATEGLARSEARLREEAAVMSTLHVVGRALAAELDLGRLVQAITDAATVVAGAEMGALFYQVRSGEPGDRLRYALSGVARERFDELALPLPRHTAMFAATLDGMEVVRVDDVRVDPRYGQNLPFHGVPDGHPIVVSYMAVPVISRSGKVIGGLFFGHGKAGMFSERNERLVLGLAAQAAVALDNAALYQEAQQLIEALERSNKDLDQFAYITSHDLKAPLRGIQNLASFIEEDLRASLTDETREHLRLLRGRVNRLEQLVEGILQYSRSARLFSKPEPVPVGALCQEIWELLAPRDGARLHLAPDLPTIVTEKVPLQQVLMNLISNALKYNPKPDPQVWIAARETAGRWELSVKDDGPGIAPRFHDRIWVIFQTLQPRDQIESTGIGLAVVRKIIEAKGGRAWVDSDEGRGATFYFTWPSRDDADVRR
jgi:signal transduction histidine kinase